MTDIETIREAARLMRQRAQAATTGPWYEDCTDGIYAYGGPDADCPAVFARVGVGSYSDAEHAAAIASPPVALAIADWLDESAGVLEQHIPFWTAPSRGVGDPPAVAWNNPQRLAELVEHHFGRPLAVARAYLGVTS